ncbi:MAG: hypothetical protein AAF570_09145 [Bacteroidota bacterium]
MKRYLILLAAVCSLTFISCTERTFVCECDEGSGFVEKAQYNDKDEAEAGCFTTEVNLQNTSPGATCLVREI